MNWFVQSHSIAQCNGVRITFELDSQPATFADVIRGLREQAGFRTLLNSSLSEVPYQTFRWETPPVSAATTNRSFECVVLDSPGLDRRPEPEAFADYIGECETDVACFRNLGKDAVLVAPRQIAEPTTYTHLASFVRRAPEAQRQSFWRTVGDAMHGRVGAKPVWLSTAGAGVAWLHVRLDDRPKYYSYGPYRSL